MPLTKVATSMIEGGSAQAFAPNVPIYENLQTITANYTVPVGSNALSAGPVTIANGVTVTVSDGSVWTIV